MRPLSIWSMYAALRKNYKLLENDHSTLAGIRVTDPIIKGLYLNGIKLLLTFKLI